MSPSQATYLDTSTTRIPANARRDAARHLRCLQSCKSPQPSPYRRDDRVLSDDAQRLDGGSGVQGDEAVGADFVHPEFKSLVYGYRPDTSHVATAVVATGSTP